MVLLEDRLCLLKRLVENDAPPTKLEFIRNETYPYRFVGSDNFNLAYLVSPPAEPEYKPFTDTATAFKIITAHGGWIERNGMYFFVAGLDIDSASDDNIFICRDWFSVKTLCEEFTFVDDGSPVGVKVEED